MAPLNVHIKHAGNKYDLELDPGQAPLAFKEAVYQCTGVPVDRMKIMVKGGVLKVRTVQNAPKKWDQIDYNRMILTGRKLGRKKCAYIYILISLR